MRLPVEDDCKSIAWWMSGWVLVPCCDLSAFQVSHPTCVMAGQEVLQIGQFALITITSPTLFLRVTFSKKLNLSDHAI